MNAGVRGCRASPRSKAQKKKGSKNWRKLARGVGTNAVVCHCFLEIVCVFLDQDVVNCCSGFSGGVGEVATEEAPAICS